MTVRGAFLLSGDGRLWSHVYSASHAENHCFAVGPSGHPSWFVPAIPATLLELEAAEADQRRQQDEAEAATRAVLTESGLRPVTAADVAGSAVLSLAEAAALIERHCGSLTVTGGGRLIVNLPRALGSPYRDDAIAAARVLYAAEVAVVACLKAKKPLPDGPTTPSGYPLTTKETTA